LRLWFNRVSLRVGPCGSNIHAVEHDVIGTTSLGCKRTCYVEIAIAVVKCSLCYATASFQIIFVFGRIPKVPPIVGTLTITEFLITALLRQAVVLKFWDPVETSFTQGFTRS